jgi:SAM-dependent methyltransferase
MSSDRDYTARLQAHTGKGWKRLLGAQAPYRRHIRRVVEGRVLDVGCGIGRNLQHLGGKGVGVDVNPYSIEVARSNGLSAYTSDEFAAGPDAAPEGYDSLLFAHVLEHMTRDEACSLLAAYLPYLRDGGRVVVIVPQEAGFRSDPTHVTFLDLDDLAQIEADRGLVREAGYSFPLPRLAGRIFTHNETVALSRKAQNAPL